MIVAQIAGGLGNQLFMYAAARAYALRTDTELQFDISNSNYANNFYGDRYQLEEFNVVGTLADPRRTAAYRPGSRSFYWRKKISRLLPIPLREVLEERRLYQPELFRFKPWRDVYLFGYWQREGYFKDHQAAIRRELTPKRAPSPRSMQVAERMRNSESAFLHVRQSPVYKFPLAPVYYTKALQALFERVPNATLFVFGDDLEWARQNIKLPADSVFVDHNDSTLNIEDLWLMTQCRHAIVANSSFSWWGAWLNGESGRTIIAPGAWGYRGDAASHWLRIDPAFCGVPAAK